MIDTREQSAALLNHIIASNAVDAKQTFDNIIATKLGDVLATRKQEIAQSLYTASETPTDSAAAGAAE